MFRLLTRHTSITDKLVFQLGRRKHIQPSSAKAADIKIPKTRLDKALTSSRSEFYKIRYMSEILKQTNKKRQQPEEDRDATKNSENEEEENNNAQKNEGLVKRLRSMLLFGLAAYATIEILNALSNIQGEEIQEQLFRAMVTRGDFTQLRIIRKLDSENRWKTTIVGITRRQNYVSQVTDLDETLVFLDKLSIPVEFEHQTKSSAVKQQSHSSGHLFDILLGVGVLLIVLGVKTNGMGLTSQITGPKPKSIKPMSMAQKTFFKDVAGMKQAKLQITEFVDFLKNPDRFIQMGARTPRGALLTGPPGTGKTMLAKACAGEAAVPFYYMSGSQFVEKYVGVGAARVRSLFQSASKNSPSIIFIDEIDAIGKKRSSGPRSNEERDNTLNQLLVCMDGFGTNSKVIVMGATNRKDMLDPALLRPGRFDRIIEIGLPDLQGRTEILMVHLQKIHYNRDKISPQDLAKKLAAFTPGFSGANLANLCNEAAILAARENKRFVQWTDFEKAAEKVLAGLDKRNTLSIEQKRIVAYHEGAKALIAWFLPGGDPVIRLSIVPRTKSNLGYAHSIPDQNSLLVKEELLDKICVALAGRAAEETVLKLKTDTSQNDLKKANKIASSIVKKFGMSRHFQNMAYPDEQMIRKPYSEAYEEMMDKEISSILQDSEVRVKQLLAEKHDLLEKLVQKLLEKENLGEAELKQILGDRPFAAKSNFKAHLEMNSTTGS